MEIGQPVKTSLAKTRTALVIAALGALNGCGGGDDGGLVGIPPGEGPAGGVGVFKDSNVTGLNYTSGTVSGVTAQDGTFNYQVGQQTTFKVGGLTLGSTVANAVVTPIDLVAGGSSATPAVLNITRLLMMADSDGDPDNGIVISANLQARAASWSQVNFADAGFDAALDTLAVDARSADGGVHSASNLVAARTHIERTFRCATSGLYRGTYTGAEQGRFGVMIDAINGDLIGLGAVTNQFGNFAVSKQSPVTIDQQMTVSGRSEQTGATFSGRLQWPDTLSGNWTKSGTTGGTFTGTRLLARRDAVFRYSGFFHDPAIPETGPVTFDVNAAGQVTGVAYGILRDQLIDFTGTLSGGTLSATASNGASISGTGQPITPTFVLGTWTGTGAAGTFSGIGCKLNQA
jgi:hypothetical protein